MFGFEVPTALHRAHPIRRDTLVDSEDADQIEESPLITRLVLTMSAVFPEGEVSSPSPRAGHRFGGIEAAIL
jgi:hypothetical protein